MNEERVREFKTELQRICHNFNIHIVGRCCGRVVLRDAVGMLGSSLPDTATVLISNSIMAMENDDV
jgi:hypothetical protein